MAERIDVQDAHRAVRANDALLVCAYDDETKCARIRLEGAVSLEQFEAAVASVPKDRTVIFYCA